jgi:hypothetical protein
MYGCTDFMFVGNLANSGGNVNGKLTRKFGRCLLPKRPAVGQIGALSAKVAVRRCGLAIIDSAIYNSPVI